MIRADQSSVHIGGYSSIGDRTVIQSSAINPTGFSSRTYIGDYVTVGQVGSLPAGAAPPHGGPTCGGGGGGARRPPPPPPSPRRRLPFPPARARRPSQGCILRACTVDDNSVVGDGCIIQEGALVDRNAMLEPGSMLPAGARVPEGEVYGGSPASFVRKLSKSEIDEFKLTATQTKLVAAKHADEFLPYGELYQLKEEMSKVKG